MTLLQAAPPDLTAAVTPNDRRHRFQFTPSVCLRIVLILVAAGSVCRISHYLSRRSFWQDEAYVILNLREKSPAELFGPLDARPGDPQAAPPAFLLIENAILSKVGVSELALRLFAQVLGLLALPLMASLAWNLLGPRPGAVCAVALFALSDQLVAHAAELKQYSGDVFFTCLLIWLATRDGGRLRSTLRRLVVVMLAAAIAVWFSYTVVFVAAAIAIAYLVASRPTSVREWGRFVLAGVPLVVSAVVLYLVCVRHQQSQGLSNDWQEFMADWSKPWSVPWWAAVETYYLANYAAESVGPIVLTFAVVGAVALWRAGVFGRPTAALLIAPIGLCFLAALARRYPYGGVRTSAFLVPVVCLLGGAGLGAMAAARHRLVRGGGWVLAGVAAAIMTWHSVRNLVSPNTRSHIRPAIEYVIQHGKPGDAVWVVGGAPSDIYRCYVNPITATTRLDVDREDPLPPLPRGRVWLLFAGSPDRLHKTIEPRLADARAMATERASHVVRGGAAYLFETPP